MSGNGPRTVVDLQHVFLMRPRGKELHRQTHVTGGKISCQWHLATSNKRLWLHFDHRPAIKRGVESKGMKNLKRGIRLILFTGLLGTCAARRPHPPCPLRCPLPSLVIPGLVYPPLGLCECETYVYVHG